MHRRLISLSRNSHLALTLTILSGLLAGILTIGQSYLISSTINGVFIEKETLQQVYGWLQLLLIVIALRGLLAWVNEVAANIVAVRVKNDLRERVFAHLVDLGPTYLRSERTGELTISAVEGIETLDAYFSQYLPQLVVSILVPATILFIVFPIDLISGLILLVTAPLIPFFMYMIGREAEGVTKHQFEILKRLSAHFLDSLQGLTTLKLFGQSKAQIQNIARVSDQFRVTTLKVLQFAFLSAFALEMLATLSTALIAVEIGIRLLYGQMQFREALFLLILAPEFYLPLRLLGQRFHAGLAGTTAARRIFEILDTPLDKVKDGRDLHPRRDHPVRAYSTFSELTLSDLSYTYPGALNPALDNISLTIKAGQHIALVGSSGAGKTTLAHILLRFILPNHGVMTVNGEPVAEIPMGDWPKLITWVPQDPHLFHDTIGANIMLGNPDASNEEVSLAARTAHLEDFIESLPLKYETVIGEGGARLSSGQAQRLAIARAFLMDSPILILDESTSSLDPETEACLEDTIQDLLSARTVITIAHRLNTVFKADQIIVLKNGRIVEADSHQELVNLRGEYASMVHEYEIPKVDSFKAEKLRSVLTPQFPLLSDHPPAFISKTTGSTTSKVSYVKTLEPIRKLQKGLFFGGGQLRCTPQKNSLLYFTEKVLLSFLKGSWGWVILSVLLGSLTIGSSVALMGTSAWLISTAALHPSIAVIEVAIVGVRFFGIARAVFRYFERLLSHNVTFNILSRVRVWFYSKLEPLAPARLMEFRSGDLLARIIGDVDTLENFYGRVVAPPMTAFLVAIGTAFFLAFYDSRLAAMLLGFFLIIGLALPIFSQALSQKAGRNIVMLRGELHNLWVDGIQGLPDILAFGRGSAHVLKINSLGKKYSSSQRQMTQLRGLFSGLSIFLTNLALWMILLITIPRITAGQLNGVLLASFALLSLASFEAVTPLPLAAQMWNSTREAARRLVEVVDTEPEVPETQSSSAEPRSSLRHSILLPNHKIQISDLSFTYPGSSFPALQHINFTLEAGRTLGIVGPSGAGKSTLVNLLSRFWDYSTGEILLGSKSLKSYSTDEVREKISLVSQKSYFFNTSIYENLRLARRGVAREEVETATRHAQIHDFIMSLPEAYDTIIGEQGLKLSGGERQRLSLARAFLKNSPILILDEPTANLDPLTEKLVLKASFEMMCKKTSLIITHRLIGLENISEILVLDHGCIVERGTQMELLNQNGHFRHLFELQNRIFDFA